MDNKLLFAKVRDEAIVPCKEKEDAGYDIYACFEEDYMVLPPHSITMVPTGIAACVSEDFYLNVADRGSTAKAGLTYAAGIVDSGYRGEIFIALHNTNETEVIISKLSKEALWEKHGSMWGDSKALPYTHKKHDNLCILEDGEGLEYLEATLYPYEKAIAQLIVHRSYDMDVHTIPYDTLKAIPSKRGDGRLGSSGK